ncbi:MAG: hemolysin III family protein [Puniceicoccales bacterium]|jgi:hemolysin III|nr:hemolysin III family protein [Puniceicoccales bacterium]
MDANAAANTAPANSPAATTGAVAGNAATTAATTAAAAAGDSAAGDLPPSTLGEEIANSVTHGIGAALSIAGLSVLVVLAVRLADVWAVVNASIYGATLVVLYTCSTLYHSIRHPGAKRLLRKFDHAAIYLLIAGTYTPFVLGPLRGALGWSIFGIIWGLALAGVVMKFRFTGRFEVLSTLLYVGMGWLILIALKPLFAQMSTTGVALLVAGGVSYTAGVVFYLKDAKPYFHAVWHLFVLGGSVLQYFSVLTTIVPPKP